MTKKERERKFLHRFKECWPSFPDGEIIEQEAPDFLMSMPTDTLGIELTELFHPASSGLKPMQAHENTENNVLKRAQEIFETNGGRPVVVYPSFEGKLDLTKAEASALASWLARHVQDLLAAPLDIVTTENEFDGSMPDEIVSVLIVKEARITQPLWATTRAGFDWVPVPAKIQAVIDGKNRKMRGYEQKCDSVWLIIVVSGEVPSQFIGVSCEAASHAYESGFEKIFLFDSFNRVIHELCIRGK